MSKLIFITGIDTGVGKTYATGLIARGLLKRGFETITMKPIQTGCTAYSEDILTHRKLMGIEITEYDKQQITSPYIFKYPASPHLAAKLEGKKIEIEPILSNVEALKKRFDYVLIEGAGGVMVPINDKLFIIDMIKLTNSEVILVSSPKLGSINHTILSVEALTSINIKIKSIIYNEFFKEDDLISENSYETIKNIYREIPIFKMNKDIEEDFFETLIYNNAN